MIARNQVFISYSHTDRSYVEKLTLAIEAAGFATWTDNHLRGGDNWIKVLKERIDLCSCVVVVMSPEAEESDWVPKEIQAAHNLGKTIVPLLLIGDDPIFSLNTLHFFDVSGGRMPPTEFYDKLRETEVQNEVEQHRRTTALNALTEKKRTVYVCNKCQFPVEYNSLTVAAMTCLFGLPFIGGTVAQYLFGWLGATLFFFVSMAGSFMVIKANSAIFMEPTTCPYCKIRLKKPLKLYR